MVHTATYNCYSVWTDMYTQLRRMYRCLQVCTGMYWYVLVHTCMYWHLCFLAFSYSSQYKMVQGISLESCVPEYNRTRLYKAFILSCTSWSVVFRDTGFTGNAWYQYRKRVIFRILVPRRVWASKHQYMKVPSGMKLGNTVCSGMYLNVSVCTGICWYVLIFTSQHQIQIVVMRKVKSCTSK